MSILLKVFDDGRISKKAAKLLDRWKTLDDSSRFTIVCYYRASYQNQIEMLQRSNRAIYMPVCQPISHYNTIGYNNDCSFWIAKACFPGFPHTAQKMREILEDTPQFRKLQKRVRFLDRLAHKYQRRVRALDQFIVSD